MTLEKRLIGVQGMLASQFLLGMGLNLIGGPDEVSSSGLKILFYILLVLHIVNAIGLLINSYLLWRARGESEQAAVGITRGFAGVALAALSGALFLWVPMPDAWKEVFSFLMAAGFIAALSFFSQALLRLKAVSPAS